MAIPPAKLRIAGSRVVKGPMPATEWTRCVTNAFIGTERSIPSRLARQMSTRESCETSTV